MNLIDLTFITNLTVITDLTFITNLMSFYTG